MSDFSTTRVHIDSESALLRKSSASTIIATIVIATIGARFPLVVVALIEKVLNLSKTTPSSEFTTSRLSQLKWKTTENGQAAWVRIFAATTRAGLQPSEFHVYAKRRARRGNDQQ